MDTASEMTVAESKVDYYLGRLGPELELDAEAVKRYAAELRDFVEQTRAQSVPANGELKSLFCYQVPAVGADGCSRIDGTFADEPYDLKPVLGIEDVENISECPETKHLFVLDKVVEKVIKDVGVNWLGFYQSLQVPDRDRALVKLVYRGAESRAEFPLTKDFARRSNNSSVGMSGKGVIINDIERYLWDQGGPYYQCDSKVHSEACLPIFSPDGEEVIGILDAESFERGKFSAKELEMLSATALVLENLLIPV